ncbi:MAG TPA: hypothetical protein VK783_16325 [Bacteroidia bacterium]|jgi:hypothetical protein|nr:hypothetical protein [Bacteroidia bacterium]
MSAEYFYDEMKGYMKEYLLSLRLTLSPRVINTHSDVLFFFTELLYHHEMCTGFEDITVAMTSSKLRAFYIRQANKILTESSCKKIMKGFFQYIFDTYGIKSDKVMKGFERK